MSRNFYNCIIVVAIVLGIVLFNYSYSTHKSHKIVVSTTVKNAVKNTYKELIDKLEKDSLRQVSIVSPNELIVYFKNIPELPPFVKLDDILLPLDSIKVPSEEILFAFRIQSEDEAYAVTGAGEIKLISPKNFKYQNP